MQFVSSHYCTTTNGIMCYVISILLVAVTLIAILRNVSIEMNVEMNTSVVQKKIIIRSLKLWTLFDTFNFNKRVSGYKKAFYLEKSHKNCVLHKEILHCHGTN